AYRQGARGAARGSARHSQREERGHGSDHHAAWEPSGFNGRSERSGMRNASLSIGAGGATMQLSYAPSDRELWARDASIGRIVSVNGSKGVVLLDSAPNGSRRGPEHRPEMGTLLVVEQATTSVLAIVSALCV